MRALLALLAFSRRALRLAGPGGGAAAGPCGRRFLLAAVILAVVPVLAAAAPPPPAREPGRGRVTGLRVPRFVSLRSSVVNVRRGPGKRYPIDWVYRRRGLPVEIVREFQNWRQVRLPDGTTGWIEQALLIDSRGFVVTLPQVTMRAAPHSDAQPVARLRQGVVGRLRHCAAASDWCSVRVHDLRGYLPRSAFWGALPGEQIGE